MFDLGWSEMLVVGVVALIVVGPKELPGMFRTVGRFTGKAKAMAREFSRAMEDAANESGVKDVAADLNKLNRISSPRKMGTDAFKKATADLNPFNEDGKAPNPGDLVPRLSHHLSCPEQEEPEAPIRLIHWKKG